MATPGATSRPVPAYFLPETDENHGAITWVGKRLWFIIKEVDDERLVTLDVAPNHWEGTFTWFGNVNAMHACRRECRKFDFQDDPDVAFAPSAEDQGLPAYSAEQREFACIIACYDEDMEAKLNDMKYSYAGKTFKQAQQG